MTGRTDGRTDGVARLHRPSRPVQHATRPCRCNLRLFLSPFPSVLGPARSSSREAEPALSEKNRRVWRMKFARTRRWCNRRVMYMGLLMALILWRPCRCEINFEISNWNLNFRMSFLHYRYAVIYLDRSKNNSGRLHVNNIFFFHTGVFGDYIVPLDRLHLINYVNWHFMRITTYIIIDIIYT